jgi:hypothetical protein
LKNWLTEPQSEEIAMRYFVTFDESGLGAIDEGSPRSFELADAQAHACRLLDEGKHNVRIGNDGDNSISGGDLVACCNGEKQMTADLKAVPISN